MIIKVGDVWYGRRGPGLRIIKVKITDETNKTIEIEDLTRQIMFCGYDVSWMNKERYLIGEFEFIEKVNDAPGEEEAK